MGDEGGGEMGDEFVAHTQRPESWSKDGTTIKSDTREVQTDCKCS